jgi:hypothetical protein
VPIHQDFVHVPRVFVYLITWEFIRLISHGKLGLGAVHTRF